MTASAPAPTDPAPQGRLAALLRTQPGPPIGPSYALRTASAAAISFFAYRLLGAQIGIWAVVSAVVVIQPDTRASLGSAALRVAANLVGASVGAAIGVVLDPQPLLALVAGMLIVALLCRKLRIDAASRSASVSAAIVLLKDPTGVLGSWEMRVLGVIIGCGVALVVTVAAAEIERRLAAR